MKDYKIILSCNLGTSIKIVISLDIANKQKTLVITHNGKTKVVLHDI